MSRRLIPAHAGKTVTVSPRASRPAAHPRSRGENTGILTATAGYAGSSPLTRGKPLETVVNWPRVGLIPAHAGKTRASTSSSMTTKAHPRSRGENHPSGGGDDDVAGSSPLTRGKPSTTATRRSPGRLIPAHAGKTFAGCEGAQHPRAHPRSRGENS